MKTIPVPTCRECPFVNVANMSDIYCARGKKRTNLTSTFGSSFPDNCALQNASSGSGKVILLPSCDQCPYAAEGILLDHGAQVGITKMCSKSITTDAYGIHMTVKCDSSSIPVGCLLPDA
jgi:hypothetical protein